VTATVFKTVGRRVTSSPVGSTPTRFRQNNCRSGAQSRRRWLKREDPSGILWLILLEQCSNVLNRGQNDNHGGTDDTQNEQSFNDADTGSQHECHPSNSQLTEKFIKKS
jgi:hypothetical protein